MTAFFVNVTDPPYNAVGDGVANDTAAIQQAINDVMTAGGGMVVFPRGTCSVESLVVSGTSPRGLQLRGADYFNARLRRRKQLRRGDAGR